MYDQQDYKLGVDIGVHSYKILMRFNRSAFNTTDTELKAMAAPASHGAKNPSMATGIMMIL